MTKAQLKAQLTKTIAMVMKEYPEIKGALKADLTPKRMAKDIMETFETFNPEAVAEIQRKPSLLAKKLKKLQKKLKV